MQRYVNESLNIKNKKNLSNLQKRESADLIVYNLENIWFNNSFQNKAFYKQQWKNHLTSFTTSLFLSCISIFNIHFRIISVLLSITLSNFKKRFTKCH